MLPTNHCRSAFLRIVCIDTILPTARSVPGHVPIINPLQILLDRGLERPLVGADNLADLLAVLEEQKGRHGADAELLRDVADLVDVDLVEPGLRVLVAELGDLGRDHFTRPAPGGEAVEHDERALGRRDDLRVVVGLAVQG